MYCVRLRQDASRHWHDDLLPSWRRGASPLWPAGLLAVMWCQAFSLPRFRITPTITLFNIDMFVCSCVLQINNINSDFFVCVLLGGGGCNGGVLQHVSDVEELWETVVNDWGVQPAETLWWTSLWPSVGPVMFPPVSELIDFSANEYILLQWKLLTTCGVCEGGRTDVKCVIKDYGFNLNQVN